MINWHPDPNSWGHRQGETALDQEALDAESRLMAFIDHDGSRGAKLEQHEAALAAIGVTLRKDDRGGALGPLGYTLTMPQLPRHIAPGQQMLKGSAVAYAHPMGEVWVTIDQADATTGFRRRATYHDDGVRTTIDPDPANTYEMRAGVTEQGLDPKQIFVAAVEQLNTEMIEPFYAAAGLDEHGK